MSDLFDFELLGIEPRTSSMLGKYSRLHSHPMSDLLENSKLHLLYFHYFLPTRIIH
jgi:hypothetical protein